MTERFSKFGIIFGSFSKKQSSLRFVNFTKSMASSLEMDGKRNLLPCFYYVRDTCVVGSSKGGRFLQN
jgi:hypothetical protein